MRSTVCIDNLLYWQEWPPTACYTIEIDDICTENQNTINKTIIIKIYFVLRIKWVYKITVYGYKGLGCLDCVRDIIVFVHSRHGWRRRRDIEKKVIGEDGKMEGMGQKRWWTTNGGKPKRHIYGKNRDEQKKREYPKRNERVIFVRWLSS